MNVRPIQPLAESRLFKPDEIFFSTTDQKGIILSGNDVFARISGFSKQELYGEPHNIIRHPDMPRAAFFLFWANLKEGRPFAGYVKNMAKDGRFYWVFVVAVPASNQRYLSVRFKPTTPLHAQVEALYAQMLKAENDTLAAGGKETEATSAGLQVAVTALKKLGFNDYDSFAQLALNREMTTRHAAFKATGIPTYERIRSLVRHLAGFVEFTQSLQQKTTSVLAVAEEFRLHSFNVNISAQSYGDSGKALSVVAGFLGDCSTQMAQATDGLRGHIGEIMKVTEAINTKLSMAHLQMEMIEFYKNEQAAKARAPDPAELEVLEECFATSTAETAHALKTLSGILPHLYESMDTITRIVLMIEMSQVLGHTETARMTNGAAMTTMFAEFRSKMDTTRAQIEELAAVIRKITSLTNAGISLEATT